MNKVLTIIVGLLLGFGNLIAQPKPKMIDEVIWIVGDEAILRSDVEAIVQDAAMRRISIDGNPYCKFPEQIAVEKLYLHQAAIDSIAVNENMINQMVENDLNTYVANVGSQAKAEEYLGKPIAQIKDEMRARYRNQSLAQQMQSKLVENIEATPAEVRRYFGKMPSDSLPSIPTQVEVQVLALKPPIPNSEINSVKEKLRDFTERANKNPKDFALLARLYSVDSISALRGGELGYMGKGMLDTEYAAVAFSMQDPNRVSRIVESDFGFHIIQFIDRRGDKINTRHILLRPKVSDEVKKEGIEKMDSIANLIRKEKLTFEQAVALYSDDKETRMNAGLMMKQDPYTRTVTSKFEYQNLPPEVAKAVYSMKIGELSDAFPMIDERTGNEMITVVRLKSKTDTHKANIREDYQLLKTILENKKKDDFLKNWIAEKQKQTYISIDPAYQDCDFQYHGWIKD